MKLGQKVTFSKKLKRTYERTGKPHLENKVWKEVPCEKTKGVIVGVRTLFKTELDHQFNYQSISNYDPIKAVLVSFDLRRKPVFIPVSEVEE